MRLGARVIQTSDNHQIALIFQAEYVVNRFLTFLSPLCPWWGPLDSDDFSKF
jgi:hypothetical protein